MTSLFSEGARPTKTARLASFAESHSGAANGQASAKRDPRSVQVFISPSAAATARPTATNASQAEMGLASEPMGLALPQKHPRAALPTRTAVLASSAKSRTVAATSAASARRDLRSVLRFISPSAVATARPTPTYASQAELGLASNSTDLVVVVDENSVVKLGLTLTSLFAMRHQVSECQQVRLNCRLSSSLNLLPTLPSFHFTR